MLWKTMRFLRGRRPEKKTPEVISSTFGISVSFWKKNVLLLVKTTNLKIIAKAYNC